MPPKAEPVPRVATNGLTFSLVTMNPLIAPHTPLTRITAKAAPQRPKRSVWSAKTHAPKAKTAPTERSNPPPIMTKVIPTATMPIGAFWLKILVTLAIEISRG